MLVNIILHFLVGFYLTYSLFNMIVWHAMQKCWKMLKKDKNHYISKNFGHWPNTNFMPAEEGQKKYICRLIL